MKVKKSAPHMERFFVFHTHRLDSIAEYCILDFRSLLTPLVRVVSYATLLVWSTSRFSGSASWSFLS